MVPWYLWVPISLLVSWAHQLCLPSPTGKFYWNIKLPKICGIFKNSPDFTFSQHVCIPDTITIVILFQANRHTQSSYNIGHCSGDRADTTTWDIFRGFCSLSSRLSAFVQAVITQGQLLSVSLLRRLILEPAGDAQLQHSPALRAYSHLLVYPHFSLRGMGWVALAPQGVEPVHPIRAPPPRRGIPRLLRRGPSPVAPGLQAAPLKVSLRGKPAWASALTCKHRLWKSKVVSLSPVKQTSSAVCFGRFADVSAEQEWISCLFLQPLGASRSSAATSSSRTGIEPWPGQSPHPKGFPLPLPLSLNPFFPSPVRQWISNLPQSAG